MRDDRRREEHRINERIRARMVMLIDETGAKLGQVPIQRAIFLAREKGLDVVEMQANANPPVCRLMDYGKYRYEIKKKQKESKKKQHVMDEKMVRLRIEIAEHDLAVKIKHTREFLSEGDKAIITIRLKGREFDHKEIAQALFERFKRDCLDLAKVDQEPRLEGNTITMVLMPLPKSQQKQKPAALPPAPVAPPAPATPAQPQPPKN